MATKAGKQPSIGHRVVTGRTLFLAFVALLLLAVVSLVVPSHQLFQSAQAASISSVQSGNWSNPSTWSGGVVPGDGDTVTIASGHTVTVDQNTTVGSTTGTAHGILINGTSPSSFGRLVVSSGVTLTLRGVSRTYYAMKVVRYGQFAPQPGSTVQVDATSDGQTGILVEGLIDARGTVQSPVLFTVPAANRNWGAVQTSVTVPTSAVAWPYDEDRNIAVVQLPHTRVANAAGTGIGSAGDTSMAITSQNPASIAQTEVASLDLVTSPGTYFVDYATGFTYFYHVYTNGNPSFSVSFRYLDDATANWRGWFIDLAASANNDVTYNEGWFDHAIFEYMGSMGGSRMPVLRPGYKRSPSVEANRNFYVKNSIFRWGGPSLTFRGSNIGTVNDPILFDANEIWQMEYSGVDTGGINVNLHTGAGVTLSYVTFSNNLIHSRFFTSANSFGSINAHDHLRIINNQQTGAVSFYFDYTPPSNTLADSEVSGNMIDGAGNAHQYVRCILDIRGATGHPVAIHDNTLSHCKTAIAVNRDAKIYRNIFTHSYFSSIAAGSGYFGYAPDVTIQNNLFFGRGTRRTTSPAYSTYDVAGAISLYVPNVGDRAWFDNWIITNNTFANIRRGALSLGDMSSASQNVVSIFTRLKFANNLIYGGEYAVQRKTDITSEVVRGGIAQFDNNLYASQSTGIFSNINRNATFLLGLQNYNLLSSPSRNVTGVELWNPSYATNQTGRALTFTVTSPNADETLQWGSGSPQQLIWQNGSLTADATLFASSYSISTEFVLTDSARSWPTTANDPGNPRGKWVEFTSGAAAGSVFAVMGNTATTLDLAPIPSTLPSTGDAYVILHSQMTLSDGAGGTLEAGIDPRSLPTTSQSDIGITVAVDRSPTGNPNLSNPTGLAVNNYQVTTGGAGIDVGATDNAPSADYWGTARPQGTTIDIGAYEFPATPAPTLAVVTPVPSATNDSTPTFTFSSNQAGTITYGGSCSSATTTAVTGNNLITFNVLADGPYANCTIRVTNAGTVVSLPLLVNSFVVDTIAPGSVSDLRAS